MHPTVPTISRGVIDAEIRAASHPGHEPARWALPLLDAIDRRAAGWTRITLDAADFAALWLPEHAGEPCHGDTMRLGDIGGGLPLRVAGAWLDLRKAAYAAANPSCWARISRAARDPRSPIVVASFGVGDRVKPPHAERVVVDGLHRALGYWLSGDRRCEAYVPVLRER
jgi:hypothetical protein